MPSLETQREKISYLDGEIRALKLAQSFLESSIKGKSSNLEKMRAAYKRMKASDQVRKQYEDYKQKVSNLKKVISKSTSQSLQEELNEMELKGML
tara:strand:- start:2735 stop:3019 length:285 start_codon:yes stop_codon:yes gene_type:complete